MAETPLSHLTVIDFTHARAGPWCTQILSELGADVIKIERPGVGDSTRGSFPQQGGMGVNFIARNRNKKSVVVDLKTDEGTAIVERLVREADVVIENFGPGVMERLGLSYESLRKLNPGLIYATVKGYGEKGPFADKKGVDLVMQAEGGIMSVTGPENGQPVKVGQAIGDIGAGLYATIGILTALSTRARTGEGQKIETNLFGTIVSFMEEYLTMYGITGENPTPYGTRHQTGVPYELFETADGHVVVYVPDGQWETVVTEILNEDSLLAYDTQQLRQEHYDEIMAAMRPVLRSRSSEEWVEIFDEIGCPCGPLNKVSDVVAHPQARAREYVFEYDDPNIGEVTLHGHPLHFSNAQTEVRSGPPKLGEHTDEVLATRLNISRSELERLRDDGIIG